jgi:hypothetical protein
MVGLVVCADAPAEAIAATERLNAHANPENCEKKPAIFMMLSSKRVPLLDRERRRLRFDGPRILPADQLAICGDIGFEIDDDDSRKNARGGNLLRGW